MSVGDRLYNCGLRDIVEWLATSNCDLSDDLYYFIMWTAYLPLKHTIDHKKVLLHWNDLNTVLDTLVSVIKDKCSKKDIGSIREAAFIAVTHDVSYTKHIKPYLPYKGNDKDFLSRLSSEFAYITTGSIGDGSKYHIRVLHAFLSRLT
jgi:hypothetical protein